MGSDYRIRLRNIVCGVNRLSLCANFKVKDGATIEAVTHGCYLMSLFYFGAFRCMDGCKIAIGRIGVGIMF